MRTRPEPEATLARRTVSEAWVRVVTPLAALSIAPAQEPEAAPPLTAPTVQLGDGLRIRSADGAFELVLEGLFQVTAVALESPREPAADFGLKRARPELSGRLPGGLRFKFEPKFTEDDVELEEAWVGADVLGGEARVMVGRMKAPFGLEEVRSRRWIDFPRFSMLNQFSPAEDHGLFLWGATGDDREWEWNAAVYNGTGGDDTNRGKDVAARLMWHPFAGTNSVWQSLQVGVAGTFGDQDEDVEGDTIDDAAGLGVLEFASGARLEGARRRLGLEAAWFHGPNFVQAEALALDQEMAGRGGDRDIGVRGFYLTLARVLTGEAKTFKGVHPDAPFDFERGTGRGAWVAALRYSQLQLDDELAPLMELGTFTDGIRGLELGLDWIPNRNTIVRLALVRSDYDDEVLVGSDSVDGSNALLLELQLHF